MKIFFVTLAFLVALAASASAYLYLSKGEASVSVGTRDATLAPQVEQILESKMRLMVTMAEDPIVAAQVAVSNEKNKSLAKIDIERLDAEWQASVGVTPFIRQFLENDVAKALASFKEKNPEFKEIFVTDQYGLNVGQTDKTSDYYQADEKWWQECYAGGAGKPHHGSIEFDESAQAEAISLYAPIKDAKGAAIGVMKGVVDLAAIKKEL